MRISKTNIRQRSVLLVLFLPAWLPDGYGQKAEQGHDAYYWTDIRDLGIMGKGWKQDTLLYNRLPAKTEGMVRDPVWSLSTHTAGFYVRRTSNATALRARWKLFKRKMHLFMPAVKAYRIILCILHYRLKSNTIKIQDRVTVYSWEIIIKHEIN